MSAHSKPVMIIGGTAPSLQTLFAGPALPVAFGISL